MQAMTWVIALLLVPAAVGPLLEAELETAWSREDRIVSATWTQDDFTLESHRDGDDGLDTIRVTFDQESGVLQYTLDAERPDNVSRTHNVSLHGLIEFEDLDGDGHYGLGDPVLQSFPVREMRASGVRVDPLDNGRYEATATYRLPGHLGSLFRLHILMTPTYETGDGALLLPTHARMTLDVEDFPFDQERATMLAVDLRWDGRLDAAATAVEEADGQWLFTHAWDPAARVDHRGAPVNTTVQAYATGSGPQTVVAFSYPEGDPISHTSTLGTDRFSDDLDDRLLRSVVGEWRLYLVGLVAAGLVVGLPIAVRRREG